MNTPWKYTENTFEIVTQGSFKLMHILITDHVARCRHLSEAHPAEALFAGALLDATAARENWQGCYAAWQSCRGRYKGATQAFYNELQVLSGLKIRQWLVAVQVLHLEGSPPYIALFPRGRKPFQKGGLDQRVNAVKILSQTLDGMAGLEALQAEVAAYYTLLEGLRLTQQQLETELDTCSAALETRRVATARLLYKNLARFMLVWWETPVRVEDGFDMSYVREGAARIPEDEPSPLPPQPPVS